MVKEYARTGKEIVGFAIVSCQIKTSYLEVGVRSCRAVAQTAFWKNLEPKTLALDVFKTLDEGTLVQMQLIQYSLLFRRSGLFCRTQLRGRRCKCK